jgi:uncharacterized membrane protein required for colicin V production
VDELRAIGAREHDEIAARVPHVLRRVGGYNCDLFNPQSERPYTPDGSVNYAHLLVGSEGTLAWTRSLTLAVSPLPKHRTLGVVNFPSLYRAMEYTRYIVKLQPSAVELVDRTMIDLARGNPAFRPVIDAALIGEPQAILLVEFAGEDASAARHKLSQLATMMSDLGLSKSVVQMTDAGAQKALWDVRKAGLNIMMSMKGDGKPVSFIEDCAVPLEHLADYVERLTEVFRKHGTRGTWYAHASVGTLHVRPILDMRRDGASKMRAIAEEASAMVRQYKGAYSGEHGDGLVRSEWVAWQFGPQLAAAFSAIDTPSVRLMLGYGICFFGVLIAGALLSFLMRKLIAGSGLSGSDRMLGMVFGLVRGLVLVTLLVLVLGFTPLARDPWWQHSQYLPTFQRCAAWISARLPADVTKYLDLRQLLPQIEAAATPAPANPPPGEKKPPSN